MPDHWEITWTTLRPLLDAEVRRAVRDIARLGGESSRLEVRRIADEHVSLRHRDDGEFFLEFGFASAAPCCSGPCAEVGLVRDGHIAWNWTSASGRQPDTRLIVQLWRNVQAVAGDKLLVWDDNGLCHWSWGSCPLPQAGLDPMTVVDAHLQHLRLPARFAPAV